MKSISLQRSAQKLFGDHGEKVLFELLQQAIKENPKLSNLTKFITIADSTVARYASLQQIQSELSEDALSDWNLSKGVISSGKKWKALLGYENNELGDQIEDWLALVHQDDLAAFHEQLRNLPESTNKLFRAECRMKGKSGDWSTILIRGHLMSKNAENRPERILVLQRNISDFKEAESTAVEAKLIAEEATRARGIFLANMSHEIRTPMNAIIGMTELALDTALNEEQQHYLQTVKTSAESLLVIINDILDFSKIEAGKLTFESIAFNLAPTLLEATRNLAVVAHKKGLELIVNIPPEIPPRIIGDPGRLRQIITNLVGNAIKFTEKGEICVNVSADSYTDTEITLRVEIKDTGIGIPKDRQHAIFEAFSQADNSTTRKFGGTGLGLSICTNLVQLMNGKIGLDSEVDKGTTFFFTGHFQIEKDAERSAPPLPDLSGHSALIILENQTACAQFKQILKRMNISAECAADPEKAMDKIKNARAAEKPFDFILADSAMPEPVGIEMANRWQEEKNPEHLLMLLTTDRQRKDMEILRALHTSIYLVRPVSPEEISTALSKLLSKDDPSEKNTIAQTSEHINTTSNTQETPDKATEIVTGDDEEKLILSDVDLNLGVQVSQEPGLDVLLVEDNPVNQDLAKIILEKMGHQVSIVNNGKEAVKEANNKRYDVILMDMQMPVMGGLEAAENIRNNEMSRSWVVADDITTVQIIAMTANAMDGDKTRCLQAGMNDYITKPIRPDVLEAALVRTLGEERALGHRKTSLEGTQPDEPDVPKPPEKTTTHESSASETRSTLSDSSEQGMVDFLAAEQDLEDAALVKKTANILLKEWDTHSKNIAHSIRTKNSQDLHRHAHTLKSLLAIFHADQACDLAAKLETQAQADQVNWTQCISCLQPLIKSLNQIKPLFQDYVK